MISKLLHGILKRYSRLYYYMSPDVVKSFPNVLIRESFSSETTNPYILEQTFFPPKEHSSHFFSPKYSEITNLQPFQETG